MPCKVNRSTTSRRSAHSAMHKISRKDPARPVIKAAEAIMQEVRGRALYLIPFRMMAHLPNHGALIRPVDTVRVTFISAGISSSGFRRHEPCCVNDPIPEIGLRRYVIGGNHRNASTRDAGQVLIPTNRVSRKQIRELMRLLKAEDVLLIESGHLGSHYTDHDQALRVLEILAVTLQGLEPAPKPITCLHQVQLIRTAVNNDPTLNFLESSANSYGGVQGLRKRIFPGHPGTDDSSVHFLLNNKMGPRHKNKLLAGAKALIVTSCAFSIPGGFENPSLLDVLVYWESKGQIGPFLDTHLSYVGPMPSQVLHSIMETTRMRIEGGNYQTTPFNTSAFRAHVGAGGKKRMASDPESPVNRKQKKRKSNARISEKRTIGRSSARETREHTSKGGSSVQIGAISKEHTDVEETLASRTVSSKDLDIHPTPSKDASSIEGSETRKTSGEKFSAPSERYRPQKRFGKDSALNQADRGENENVSRRENEVAILLKSLEEQKFYAEEAVRLAVEKERRVLQTKHNAELETLKTKLDPSRDVQNKERSEIDRLKNDLAKLKEQKNADIAQLEAQLEERKRNEDGLVKKMHEENAALRVQLEAIRMQQSRKEETEKLELQTLRDENAKMKEQLSSAEDSSVRRTGRARIPSDKMIASMSAEMRRELLRKLQAYDNEDSNL